MERRIARAEFPGSDKLGPLLQIQAGRGQAGPDSINLLVKAPKLHLNSTPNRHLIAPSDKPTKSDRPAGQPRLPRPLPTRPLLLLTMPARTPFPALLGPRPALLAKVDIPARVFSVFAPCSRPGRGLPLLGQGGFGLGRGGGGRAWQVEEGRCGGVGKGAGAGAGRGGGG